MIDTKIVEAHKILPGDKVTHWRGVKDFVVDSVSVSDKGPGTVKLYHKDGDVVVSRYARLFVQRHNTGEQK